MSARDYVNLVKSAISQRAPKAGALPGCATPRERLYGGRGGMAVRNSYRPSALLPYRRTALRDFQHSRLISLLVASLEAAGLCPASHCCYVHNRHVFSLGSPFPAYHPDPCVPDHSVCLDLEKDFFESVIFVGRNRKQQNRIEELMGEHENKPASETGKAKFYWRVRWLLFIGVAVIVGTWII